MPSWWGKSSSKETKKKKNKEGLIDALGLRSKVPSEANSHGKPSRSKKRSTFPALERGSHSRSVSRLSPPSEQVPRCQSFSEGPHSQPLPSPAILPSKVVRTHSHSASAKHRVEKAFKPSLFLPIPRPVCIRKRRESHEFEGNVAVGSASSGTSIASDDPIDSGQRSPIATDFDNWNRIAESSPSRSTKDDSSTTGTPLHARAPLRPANPISSNPISPHMWTKKKHFQGHLPKLQLLPRGTFYSAPNSSPCKSPIITPGNDQMNSSFWAGRPYQDAHILGSGHCSSPGSGYNSGQNSMGGDMSGPLFWQPSRSSPEYSPIPSPIMTSPGPGSRIHSGAVTPLHPRAGGLITEVQTSWNDEGKQQSHPLPLPPQTLSNSSPYSRSNSAATSPSVPRSPGRAATSPSVPRSPGRAENFTSLGSCWKKGKMLGRGTFGHVYVGFNSESGEMCAMKEVTLFYDDTKSKECTKQLVQEIALLSRLRHPNIVQYYGSEMVGDKLYIYLEYVSGGSIYKLLQDYGQFGELVIRNYTQQILSGLSYLHERNTVHRDIKGANILVDPNGRVKLADFGMAKHITGQSCPLSFKGSPYWMAPEVIKNSNGCNISVDIWSLGCTVLEMATTKPPWGQYEGVAAMFKIGNSKDLPFIPDHLSDEGKDFVRKCLQRNPLHRPTAAQLLEHPFVKNPFPAVERQPSPGSDFTVTPLAITRGMKSLGIGEGKSASSWIESEKQTARSLKAITCSSGREGGAYSHRYISCPVSPIGSPILHSRSPNSSTTSPPPIHSHFLHTPLRPTHTSPPLHDTSRRAITPVFSDREFFSGPFYPSIDNTIRPRVPPHPFPLHRTPGPRP